LADLFQKFWELPPIEVECTVGEAADDTLGHATTAPRQLPPGLRILLVEDGRDNRLLVTVSLQGAGSAVHAVADGKQALEAVSHANGAGQPFDLILMDMHMPVMDGYQATRMLRATECRVPIVALTAGAMAGDRERCLQAGCDDYVAKPFDWRHLIEVVARHVRPGRNLANGVP
jgi:CheY-like chemotaxis protein